MTFLVKPLPSLKILCFGDGILLSIVLKMDFTENTFGRSRLDIRLLSNDQGAHKK